VPGVFLEGRALCPLCPLLIFKVDFRGCQDETGTLRGHRVAESPGRCFCVWPLLPPVLFQALGTEWSLQLGSPGEEGQGDGCGSQWCEMTATLTTSPLPALGPKWLPSPPSPSPPQVCTLLSSAISFLLTDKQVGSPVPSPALSPLPFPVRCQGVCQAQEGRWALSRLVQSEAWPKYDVGTLGPSGTAREWHFHKMEEVHNQG
jgi:hypothetical protein